MKLRHFILSVAFLIPFIAHAQKDLKKECVSVAMFSAAYSYQLPGADTKVLYGSNSTIGASFQYKTDKNWLWEASSNFIFGDSINASREEILGIILDNNGELITGDGIYGSYALLQRGYNIQAKFGKLFNVCAPNPNSGFFIKGGLGYLLNRVRIEFSSSASPPANLAGDYLYGYGEVEHAGTAEEKISYFT